MFSSNILFLNPFINHSRYFLLCAITLHFTTIPNLSPLFSLTMYPTFRENCSQLFQKKGEKSFGVGRKKKKYFQKRGAPLIQRLTGKGNSLNWEHKENDNSFIQDEAKGTFIFNFENLLFQNFHNFRSREEGAAAKGEVSPFPGRTFNQQICLHLRTTRLHHSFNHNRLFQKPKLFNMKRRNPPEGRKISRRFISQK